MFWKILCLPLLLNFLCCVAKHKDEYDELTEGKAPFFELPCMRIGGICARNFACPPGTRIGRRGLCPDQQPHGMECCRPVKVDKRCTARNGDCIARKYKCPSNMILEDVTDCNNSEVCCLYAQNS